MSKLSVSRSEHLLQLAKRVGVTVTWVQGWHAAEAFPELRQICVPCISSGADYLVALHELGHVLSPLGRLLDDVRTVEANLHCEFSAWAWAVSNAHPELIAPYDLEAVWTSLRSHVTRELDMVPSVHGPSAHGRSPQHPSSSSVAHSPSLPSLAPF